MQYYANIVNSLVTNVIVADDNFINKAEGEWVQTFYDGSLRKNFAGIGHTYDTTIDAFIPPKPYNSWLLNEDTCQWESPIPHPETTEDSLVLYDWNEETTTWLQASINKEAEEA